MRSCFKQKILFKSLLGGIGINAVPASGAGRLFFLFYLVIQL